MTTISDMRLSDRSPLAHWRPMIAEWLKTVERYCSVLKGDDAPYVYTERANTGILASAAWLSGYVALEEFQSPKGLRNKFKTSGRVDLYLASNEFEEIVEAKQSWISLGMSGNRQVDHARKKLNNAVDDARLSRAGDAELACTGVAFLSGYLSDKRKDKLEQFIHGTVETFRNADFPLVAWCFPKEVRALANDNGEMLPGIILVASNG